MVLRHENIDFAEKTGVFWRKIDNFHGSIWLNAAINYAGRAGEILLQGGIIKNGHARRFGLYIAGQVADNMASRAFAKSQRQLMRSGIHVITTAIFS